MSAEVVPHNSDLVADGEPTRFGGERGLTPSEAATRRWRKYREHKEAVEREAVERAAAVITETAELAAEVLERQLEHEDPRVAQAAAKDLLDRLGLKAIDRLELSGRDGGPVETLARLDETTIAAKLAEAGLVRAEGAEGSGGESV